MNAVEKIKARPLGPFRAPRVVYVCRTCKFRAYSLTCAWIHSETHGPYEHVASAAEADELKLSARARQVGSTRSFTGL